MYLLSAKGKGSDSTMDGAWRICRHSLQYFQTEYQLEDFPLATLGYGEVGHKLLTGMDRLGAGAYSGG